MTDFFTADTHFGHKNIIEYAQRPYANVEEMNEAMVTLWNVLVGPTDRVFHLGDFAFLPKDRTKEFVQRLNGIKTLIMGNHDLHRKVEFWLEAGFQEVYKLGYGKVFWYAPHIALCHYPDVSVMDDYDKRDWLLPHAPDMKLVNSPTHITLLHGHVHTAWKHKHVKLSESTNLTMLNVGVDVWDQKPISMFTLDSYFKQIHLGKQPD